MSASERERDGGDVVAIDAAMSAIRRAKGMAENGRIADTDLAWKTWLAGRTERQPSTEVRFEGNYAVVRAAGGYRASFDLDQLILMVRDDVLAFEGPEALTPDAPGGGEEGRE